MEEWYYKHGDSQFGPISETQLRALFHRGKISSETMVKTSHSDDWNSLGNIVFSDSPAIETPPSLPILVQPVLGPSSKDSSIPASLWIFALLLLVNMVTLGFMQLTFSLYALSLLAGVTGMPNWFLQFVEALDAGLVWPRAGLFILLITWQGCAFGSLRKLYEDGIAQHGRGSGFWWITPIANLFMPFQCLKEMRWLSRKRRHAPQAGIPAGVLIWLIQAILIFNILLNVADKALTASSGKNPEAMDEAAFTLATCTNLSMNLGGMVFAILTAAFVLQNLIHQIRLYQDWNAEE